MSLSISDVNYAGMDHFDLVFSFIHANKILLNINRLSVTIVVAHLKRISLENYPSHNLFFLPSVE